MKRLFIAIDVSDRVRELAIKTKAQLKDELGTGRWVNPDNIHLTIKFLGSCEESRLPAIIEQTSRVAAQTSQLIIDGGEIGAFPNSRRPRVVWLGIRPTSALRSLHRLLEDALEAVGFEKDEREFSPHLTLARIKVPRRVDWSLTAGLDKLGFRFKAEQLVLYESITAPKGVTYKSIEAFRFRDANA